MPAFKPRNKVLLFRLTQDEYDSLLAACAERGGRTLSEFARTELLQRLPQDNGLYRVNERLDQLQSAVQEVTGLLEAIVSKKSPQT